jgi:hypothetical protein
LKNSLDSSNEKQSWPLCAVTFSTTELSIAAIVSIYATREGEANGQARDKKEAKRKRT